MAPDLITAFFLAWGATVAFGILLQSPKNMLWIEGIVGAIGWVLFIFFRDTMHYSSFYSNFLATVALALVSEIAARIFKQPVIVFVIPGIIPLVPGMPMYQGMSKVIENNYDNGITILLSAAMDGAAIALGMMFVTSVFAVIKISANNFYGHTDK